MKSDEWFESILALAEDGSNESLGRLLESCRDYLLLIANQKLDRQLIAKTGASDLVQETFAEAHKSLASFRGATRAEFQRWLRQILLNHLLTARRKYLAAGKRAVGRETSLDGYLNSGADGAIANTCSPSSHQIRVENIERVQAALLRLPRHYQSVIRLRHHHQLTFDEVGRRFGLSGQATRQLWARAIKRLRRELQDVA